MRPHLADPCVYTTGFGSLCEIVSVVIELGVNVYTGTFSQRLSAKHLMPPLPSGFNDRSSSDILVRKRIGANFSIPDCVMSFLAIFRTKRVGHNGSPSASTARPVSVKLVERKSRNCRT